MRLNHARRDALSLIEVLASLAIFLMSLTAIVHLINTSTQLAGQSRHRAHAAQLCKCKLAEMCAGVLPLSGGGGTCEDETDYHWSAEAEPGAAEGLYNVTVRVRYKPDTPDALEVVMSRMILDPTVCGSSQDVPAAPAESSSENMTAQPTGQ
jgi:hypothetical protein